MKVRGGYLKLWRSLISQIKAEKYLVSQSWSLLSLGLGAISCWNGKRWESLLHLESPCRSWMLLQGTEHRLGTDGNGTSQMLAKWPQFALNQKAWYTVTRSLRVLYVDLWPTFETRTKSDGQYWLGRCLLSQLKVIIRTIIIITIVHIPTIFIIWGTVDQGHFVLRAVGTHCDN